MIAEADDIPRAASKKKKNPKRRRRPNTCCLWFPGEMHGCSGLRPDFHASMFADDKHKPPEEGAAPKHRPARSAPRRENIFKPRIPVPSAAGVAGVASGNSPLFFGGAVRSPLPRLFPSPLPFSPPLAAGELERKRWVKQTKLTTKTESRGPARHLTFANS